MLNGPLGSVEPKISLTSPWTRCRCQTEILQGCSRTGSVGTEHAGAKDQHLENELNLRLERGLPW